MPEQMTIEHFNDLKAKMQKIFEDAENYSVAHSRDMDYDEDKYIETVKTTYFDLQKLLASCDLSAIPFENWEGIYLMADKEHPLDFSGTRANIDFNLIQFDIGEGTKTNFQNCKVRNISSLFYYDEHTFSRDVMEANPTLFLLGDFPDTIKSKFYSFKAEADYSIQDLATLSAQQIKELQTKRNFSFHWQDKNIINLLGLDKALELYHYSEEVYEELEGLLNGKYARYRGDSRYVLSNDELLDQIKNCPRMEDARDLLYNELKMRIYTSNSDILSDDFSENLRKVLSPLFYITKDDHFDLISTRLCRRLLALEDIIAHPEVLKDVPVEYFLWDINLKNYGKSLGYGKIGEIIEANLEFLKDIPEADESIVLPFLRGDSIEEVFNQSADVADTDFMQESVPLVKALKDQLGNEEAWRYMIQYKKYIDCFTSYYSHIRIPFPITKDNLVQALEDKVYEVITQNRMEYSENLPPHFKERFKELFLGKDVPAKIKTDFYKRKINPSYLFYNPSCIPFLLDTNLHSMIRTNIQLCTPGAMDAQGQIVPQSLDFMDEYASRYGQEKLLQLLAKYGDALTDISIFSFHDEIEDIDQIEASIKRSIYNKIMGGNYFYAYLENCPDFVKDYPELFIDFEKIPNIPQAECERLKKAFYGGQLAYDDIKKYPILIEVLKDKELRVAFSKAGNGYRNARDLLGGEFGLTISSHTQKNSDLALLEAFGSKKFLSLCVTYGRYMDGIESQLRKMIAFVDGKYVPLPSDTTDTNKSLSFEDITEKIEEIIARECKSGNILYGEDAPDFLKESHPELFLSEDAPEELRKYFYSQTYSLVLDFEVLKEHKDWLPYLKDKAILTALLKNGSIKPQLQQFIESFGEDKVLKLGINRAETVMKMLTSKQVSLMKTWYDKTGGKFIPDYVVMQNFPLDEVDKFLVSGVSWSNLMRIKSYANTAEGRDAMLRMAYSFGVFDSDQRGTKKLQDLLTGIPRKIDAEYSYILEQFDLAKRQNDEGFTSDLGSKMENFIEVLKSEKVAIDLTKDIFAQIYRKNEDGSYTLTISPQSYPKTAREIRALIEENKEFPILSAEKAHRYLGGFRLTYDSDFREFFLANIDSILVNKDYLDTISEIQRRFKEIKSTYSNVHLTLQLAFNHVKDNRFENVNVGNESVARVATMVSEIENGEKYTQEDFEVLQKIFNYGKQRVFSSIPRIEGQRGKYSYEMLRLDDAMALGIGHLTDCCQHLGGPAEVCMEHSMVDKNGRVFVVYDEEGNRVAQSWVWRNKDIICFDNIEIPNKAFARAQKSDSLDGKKKLTDDIYGLYRQAAHELMEIDAQTYKELLESGKITQEQYDGLRLGKVTVGLGHNDIAESLKEKAPLDTSAPASPEPFEPPVKLYHSLYLDDSRTQFILEEREGRVNYNGETLPIYHDDYLERDDSKFTKTELKTLKSLELVTKENPYYFETQLSDQVDSEHLVSALAINYNLNPSTTRVIVHPNFAIIYDTDADRVRIGDLLFNTRIDNGEQQMDIEDKVVMQMRLALDQIGADKEVDISSLNEKQKGMYAKAKSLTEEDFDVERGLSHGK